MSPSPGPWDQIPKPKTKWQMWWLSAAVAVLLSVFATGLLYGYALGVQAEYESR